MLDKDECSTQVILISHQRLPMGIVTATTGWCTMREHTDQAGQMGE